MEFRPAGIISVKPAGKSPYGEEKVQTPNAGASPRGCESSSRYESAGRGFDSLCGLQFGESAILAENGSKYGKFG